MKLENKVELIKIMLNFVDLSFLSNVQTPIAVVFTIIAELIYSLIVFFIVFMNN